MVESIITVGLAAVQCLAPPSELQFSYLRNYTSNIENLREGIRNLKNDRDSIQHAVDGAERNGEVVENNVVEWRERVDRAIFETEQFLGNEAAANNRCFKGLCPNLKDRLQRSKEAVSQMEVVSKLRNDGRFDRISYRSSPENIRLLLSEYYEAFESRKSILKDILDALKNPDVNEVGICGLGGIGKTTLAKVVAKQVKSDKVFDQVVFVEVSQSQDIKKIQQEIADQLGVQFGDAGVSGRADKLWDRLKKEKNILLILDNIWDKFAFPAIGIPHGHHHKGCKILLTARSGDTLSKEMDCQRNFQIDVLDDEEAWRLFKKMAGEYIESSQYKSIATDVLNECGGLPIFIVAVARALSNKLVVWKNALQRLRRPSSSANYKNIQKEAYSAIEFSYNHLESEELKNVFLLVGYSYISNVDELLMYGMGLHIFEDISLMDEARVRVQTLVYKLKASFMLLEDSTIKDEKWFSMHDVVRDVAISIACAKGELYDQWKSLDESVVKPNTSMVLRDVDETIVFSEVSKCSRLKFLSISGGYSYRPLSIMIPDLFFTEMTELRVLALSYMNLRSLPSSLGHLTKLQTLCLNGCNVEDVAVVGGLKMLKILRIKNLHVRKLPKEICELTQLRLLDLRGCWNLRVIAPNVLSKLSLLEELHIAEFTKWEEEEVEEGLKNASLDELKHLPHLTTLELEIEDVNILPKGLFFEKLERYNIRIGVEWVESGIEWEKSCRVFQLALNTNISLKDGIIVQPTEVEALALYGLQEEDMNYFASELLEGGFRQLKHLKLRDCAAPSNTRELKCQESVFLDLQYLSVGTNQISWICQSTEDFFCKLKCLDVHLDESSKKNLSSLDDLFPRFFFPTVKFLRISGFRDWRQLDQETTFRRWKMDRKNYSLNKQLPSPSFFDNVTTLNLSSCPGFIKLLSSSTAKSLVQLRRMIIDFSRIIIEIVADDEGESEAKDEIVFIELQELTLVSLSSLTSFCSGNRPFRFPSLENLVVDDCPNMKIFCEGELSTPILHKVHLTMNKNDKQTWKGDLNTTIEQLYLDTRKR